MKRCFAALLLLLLLSSCSLDRIEDFIHSYGTGNTESLTEATTAAEELVSTTEAESTLPEFDIDRAYYFGTFDNEIYGMLYLYLQDGYLLLYEDTGDLKFSVWAEDYTVPEGKNAQLLMRDLDFDGFNDIALPLAEKNGNKYYYCFRWDMITRNYAPVPDFANIPNPTLDTKEKLIRATDNGGDEPIELVYSWDNNNVFRVTGLGG